MSEKLESTNVPEILPLNDQIQPVIMVDRFIYVYGVTNLEVQEILEKYPTLCYSLGCVSEESQTSDPRPDGIERPVYFLVEGSGMFNLRNPDDAMRWRGIFNHIVGSSRHVAWLTEKLKGLSDEQRKIFEEKGFDFSEFDLIAPEKLVDFMLVSHAGRRQMDEYKWHPELQGDKAHPSDDSYQNTVDLLSQNYAPQIFRDFMRIEEHDHLMTSGKNGLLPNITDNVLTYSDWTFGQEANSLEERFKGLRKSRRADEATLTVLENCSTSFETALKEVLGENIWEEMANAGPYEWEQKIRKAYCAPSGISLENTFPSYIQYLQQFN